MQFFKKATLISALAGIALSAVLSGCDLAGQRATLSIQTTLSAPRAVVAGTTVTSVDSYRVVFKKIEIGNSELDKYTLWEDAAGATKDITGATSFSPVNAIPAGSYQFVRLTIGDTLQVDGSIVDGATTYTGSGSAVLGDTVYLWGTSLMSASGAPSLSAPVVVRDGGVMSFNFDIANTVSYQGGPASAAVLSVTKPVMSVSVQ